MSANPYMYQRFILPSKKMVEVRRVEEGRRPEVVVREVNDDNQLSHHEFNLKLEFLLKYGKQVPSV